MTEEIYKNGDTYYIKTLLGEIKMFDKDGNEINWTPTQNLGDKVILAYINEQLKRLEQENKELQAYKDINEDFKKAWDELNKKHKQLRSALEEIKEVLKFYADTWIDEKIYPNLHYDNTKAKEGLSRINEVLNDN